MPALDADSAHIFLQSHTSICAGLLEDPKGSGNQFVVSVAGMSQWLLAYKEASRFFSDWDKDIQAITPIEFPTLCHVFYLAYEAGTLFEQLPKPKTIPDGGLIWRHTPDWCLCFQPQQQQIYVSSTLSEDEVALLEGLVCDSIAAQSSRDKQHAWVEKSSIKKPKDDYQETVEKVREYISQGDVFQANIARFWQCDFDESGLEALYEKLRDVNPAPFASFFKVGDLTLISASPERLFSINPSGKVAARPIAGTRKRSDGEEDHQLSNELLLSEKERAEHIMLLDLERNDLGRVCVPGSIHVDECMIVEKYATVQHIVSNVTGQIQAELGMLDVLKAMFPGGTITGCPKVRCMEIIHALENNARGPYTGGLGYMAWDGGVDMNILIRTFWFWQGQLKWAAGAGIVADSVPAHEEVETEHKVAGLMRVFE